MTECILFGGAGDGYGYGTLWCAGRTWKAHRLAWTRARGAIPEGAAVLHRCDNRRCINPEHLFLGSLGDNNRDRARKGRSARGVEHGLAKLDVPHVKEIMRRLIGGDSMSAIARDFGLFYTTIRAIRDGRTWTNVTGGAVPYKVRRSCRKRT